MIFDTIIYITEFKSIKLIQTNAKFYSNENDFIFFANVPNIISKDKKYQYVIYDNKRYKIQDIICLSKYTVLMGEQNVL